MPYQRIPISAARELAEKYGLCQVIIWTWDHKTQQVITYGKTLEDCDQAAKGGNVVKQSAGWPLNECDAEPSRVKKMKAEIKALKQKVADLEAEISPWRTKP